MPKKERKEKQKQKPVKERICNQCKKSLPTTKFKYNKGSGMENKCKKCKYNKSEKISNSTLKNWVQSKGALTTAADTKVLVQQQE